MKIRIAVTLVVLGLLTDQLQDAHELKLLFDTVVATIKVATHATVSRSSGRVDQLEP